MAFVVTQVLGDVGNPDAVRLDFWNVNRTVRPADALFSTDTMLVQSLLVAYFNAPVGPRRPDLKSMAMHLLSGWAARGKRFDDGYYGEVTREVLRLFEEDQIVDQTGFVSPIDDSDFSSTPRKLMRLNRVFDLSLVGTGTLGTSKQEVGRRMLRPELYKELYP